MAQGEGLPQNDRGRRVHNDNKEKGLQWQIAVIVRSTSDEAILEKWGGWGLSCCPAGVHESESLVYCPSPRSGLINPLINYQLVEFRYYLFGYEFNTVKLDSYRFAYRFD